MADIRFNCSGCGQTLEAPPEMAGDLVGCPSCGQELTVPAPAAPSPAPAAQGAPMCPGCGAEMEPESVLCVQCGYHLKLGKKIETDLS